MTALIEALYRGQQDRVDELLAADPALTVHETAAIHAAVAAEGKEESVRYELVKLALEHGADPNLRQGAGDEGFRAIDAARQNGDKRIEELLIAHGAEN